MASQEDDATELQFPKDEDMYDYSFANNLNEFVSGVKCCICKRFLEVPYIECVTCLAVNIENEETFGKICLRCLAKGNETSFHKNDHKYIIKRQNFSLLNKNWQAKEELQLLNAIMECGIGNWIDISKHITSKSPNECKRHYFEAYVDNPIKELVTLLPKTSNNSSISTYRSHGPTNVFQSPETDTHQDIAGYNAARNDFIIEHLNDAEKIIGDINPVLFDENTELSLEQTLEFALIDIYKNSLHERQFRKSVIKEHGLMDLYKSSQRFNYSRSHFPELSKKLLPKLHSLTSFEELTYLTEGLHSQALLKKKILELKEYRENGLMRNSQTRIYKTLNRQREINLKRKQKLKFGPNGKEMNIDELSKLSLNPNSLPSSMKRISLPLNIAHEPLYHTLSDEEKKISSAMRIVPKTFNLMKATMIEECRKHSGLKLWQARLLFKIDVNKIRMMYDYLVKEGFIY